MLKYTSVIIMLLFARITMAQTADEIIDKHLAATGGKDKWAKVYSLKTTGTFTLGPGMQAPVMDIKISRPFKGLYGEFSWQGMTAKNAMRADSGWNYQPFNGKRDADPMTANDIRTNKLGADPQGLLFNYKEKGYTAEYLGTDDMDGTDVFKIRLTTKDGDMVYYYIDAETYYIIKQTVRIKLKDKEQKNSVIFSDFRKTDFGVVVPFSSQSVDEDGNEQGGPINITKVEINQGVDPSLFDKPKSK